MSQVALSAAFHPKNIQCSFRTPQTLEVDSRRKVSKWWKKISGLKAALE